MTLWRFIFLLINLTHVLLWAHGEDKTGPHGGFLKMPGTFHTEVLPINDTAFDIYLIDISFKNPVVQKSKVSAKIRNAKTEIILACKPQENYFRCSGENKFEGSQLVVTASRDGSKDFQAVYDLPLKTEDKNIHGGH